jgi:D-3-phosphoglycerate dehydrogenase / 2-oxoglutarate reductase
MEIVILDSGYKSYAFEEELFEGNGYSLKIYPAYKGDPAEKKRFAENAAGILVRHTKIDENFLSGLKNLKAIVRYGVGHDNVDINACTKHGIRVANVRGYADHAVSDHALALMFTCIRAMWDVKSQITQHYASPPSSDIFELHDKTLGIIGLGRIGSQLCKKTLAMFKTILACDPYKPSSYFHQLSARQVELDELLKKSDIISLHCTLNEETTHLIDQKAFSMMNRKPVLINTARGEVIDEKALLEALNSRKIHSAGLDVFEDEPVTKRQNELINHTRTICTGHYAWYSDRSIQELQKRAALNLFNLLEGNPVADCLNS